MLLTLDDAVYTAKPPRSEISRIMNRMKAAEPREVDKAEFVQHVAAGKSFVGGAFADDLKDDSLISMELFCLDFDNDTEALDADGQPLKDEQGHIVKRPLLPTEDGYLSAFQALDRCESLGLAPMLLYQSLRCSKDNQRYRIVFHIPETVTDYSTAQAIMESLHIAFPEADKRAANPNRIWFGTNKAVWMICESWFL